MSNHKSIVVIFHDLFLGLFLMLIIFAVLEWKFSGFVVSYLNLNLWFLATLICASVYLMLKSEKDS
ncbi:MAG: hypothetical protein AAB731_04440 [Patescibacteria group bacterium]